MNPDFIVRQQGELILHRDGDLVLGTVVSDTEQTIALKLLIWEDFKGREYTGMRLSTGEILTWEKEND